MKIYITKFALTKGIQEIEAESTQFPNMVKKIGKYIQTFHKPFWHESKKEAIEHAEILRKIKIESLKKSIQKFEKLDFNRE